MGAGILPITIHKGKLLFLFSREYIGGKLKRDKGKWSDFGGGTELGESIKATAIREGWEESSGFLGNIENISKLVNTKTVTKISYKGYTTYVVYIKYNKKLPSKFNKQFARINASHPEKISTKGLYEKDLIEWVSYDDIRKNYNIFRPFYKHIVKRILSKFKYHRSI